jgi:hypothetical protein
MGESVKLNLHEWSSVAEILSSIAVLATLVFLVFELRQNTDAIRASTYQEMNAVISQVNGIFLENPEVSEFVARTASGQGELDPHDAIRLRAFISSQYRHADNVYFQYQIGTISKRQMKSLLHPIVLNFQRRGRLRDEWLNGADRKLLSPDLVTYLEQQIALQSAVQ